MVGREAAAHRSAEQHGGGGSLLNHGTMCVVTVGGAYPLEKITHGRCPSDGVYMLRTCVILYSTVPTTVTYYEITKFAFALIIVNNGRCPSDGVYMLRTCVILYSAVPVYCM
jgi:hypothetical protein